MRDKSTYWFLNLACIKLRDSCIVVTIREVYSNGDIAQV